MKLTFSWVDLYVKEFSRYLYRRGRLDFFPNICIHYIPFFKSFIYHKDCKRLDCSFFTPRLCDSSTTKNKNKNYCTHRKKPIRVQPRECVECFIQENDIYILDERKKKGWFKSVPYWMNVSEGFRNCLNCDKRSDCNNLEDPRYLKLKDKIINGNDYNYLKNFKCKDWKNVNYEYIIPILPFGFTKKPYICPICKKLVKRIKGERRYRIQQGKHYQWYHGGCDIEKFERENEPKMTILL